MTTAPCDPEPKPCRECGSSDITPGNVKTQNWRCRACVKAYREEHRSHILRYMKEYHAENYDRDLSRMRDWRKLNRP